MNERFEYQGYRWLPGADEEKVPGILKFDPDDGAILDLLGSLKGLKGVIDPLEPEIILGLSPDGNPITLKDCGRTLIRLTKPLHVTPADQRTSKVEKRLTNVGPPLIAHLQPPKAVDPRQWYPLHHPPMPSQPLAGLDAAPRSDARLCPSSS